MKTIIEKYQTLKKLYKRRNKNEAKLVKMALEFLHGDHIKYGGVIFLMNNSEDVNQLHRVGCVQETDCFYRHSEFILYWEKYNIEIEVVSPQEWERLFTCIRVANATDFFDLNRISAAIDNEVIDKKVHVLMRTEKSYTEIVHAR